MRAAASEPDLARGTRAGPRRLTLVIPGLGGGGAERILTGLANRWARAGDDVTIVTLGSMALDAYAVDSSVQRVALDLLHQSRHVIEGLVQASRRVLALRQVLLGIRPDVVVSFMGSTNVLTLLAAAGSGLPVFVCERTDPRSDPVVLHRPSWALLRRALYPRAAGVIVQTESVAGWARAFCRRVHVIPNFVEPSPRIATPGVEHGPKRLVAVGRLGPEKGFDLLIQAFARLAAAHPDWSLFILGEGGERARLEALVRDLQLGDRVSLPGRAADPVPLLAAAHAFALSSHREGFPNALLEAMACGLPVVAFDCRSGPAEIITHDVNGLLVPAGDVARLAETLDRVMGSPSERARLGQSAREIVKRLDPDGIVAMWNAALATVVRT